MLCSVAGTKNDANLLVCFTLRTTDEICGLISFSKAVATSTRLLGIAEQGSKHLPLLVVYPKSECE
jgi:hypothetical protein